MQLITLTAKRKNGATFLYNENGTLKATFPNHLTQPHGNKKTIILNCWRFALVWDKKAKKV